MSHIVEDHRSAPATPQRSCSGRHGVSAEVVCDSVSPTGVRVVTVQATLHRFVLAELNTHRVFSRNSSSSRAIPVIKQVGEVRSNPALPVEFGTNQAGMQAGGKLSGDEFESAHAVWLQARDAAAEAATMLAALGVHKQVANRLIEPFMWHTVIITSTDWYNFFNQRCHRDAQPEIRELADAIRSALHASVPRYVGFGDWHLPFVEPSDDLEPVDALMVSAARCARVSYLTHDGRRDTREDLALYRRLVSANPPHLSPLEHVATPSSTSVPGNLNRWLQLRHHRLLRDETSPAAINPTR